MDVPFGALFALHSCLDIDSKILLLFKCSVSNFRRTCTGNCLCFSAVGNASLSYKLVQHTRFECLRERTLSLLEVLINIDFKNKVCVKIYTHY